MANLVKANVIDQAGKECDQSWYVDSSIHDPTDAAVTSIWDAMTALIDGGNSVIELEVDAVAPVNGTATSVGYNAADKIRFTMKSGTDLSLYQIDVPAPGGADSTAVAIFNDDGTVNQGCPAVAAAITFLNANFLDSNGNPCFFKGGFRVRSERLKTAF